MLRFILAFTLIAGPSFAGTPGGRLTLVSGQPEMTADAKSATVWYAPDNGATVPVFDGYTMAAYNFTSGPTDQIGQSLDVSRATAGSALDVMETLVYGVPTLCSIPFVAAPPAVNKLASTGYVTTGTAPVAWQRPGASNDGALSQSTIVGARLSPSNIGQYNWIGQDLGSPRFVTAVKIYGPNNDYIRGDGASHLPVMVRASNDGATWTTLYAGALPNDASSEIDLIDVGNQLNGTRSWRYYEIGLSGNGINAINVAEVEFYGPDAVAARGLTRYEGVLVNDATATCQTDAGPITCAAYFCSYLGSVLISSTAGVVECEFSYGPSRQCGVWNAYNQRKITLQAGVQTSNAPCAENPLDPRWSCYIPTTSAPLWTAAQNDARNSLTVFSGMPQATRVRYTQSFYINQYATGSSGQYQSAIGLNNATTPAGPWGSNTMEAALSGTNPATDGRLNSVEFFSQLIQGANVFYALENYGYSGTKPMIHVWAGQRDMTLSASYYY